MNLHGRVVVVTGSNGQLGGRLTTRLIERGARVAGLDRLAKPSQNGSMLAVTCDVTSRKDVEEARHHIMRTFGAVHAVINCAGIDMPPDSPLDADGSLAATTLDQFMHTMRTNVGGVYVMAQVFGSALATTNGVMVNIGSLYGKVAPDQRLYNYRVKDGQRFFKPASYGASKAAVAGLTKWLASYWRKEGVRVVNIIPGGIRSSQDERFVEAYTVKTLTGRMADVDEIVGPIIFAITDDAAYMNGCDITVDGGFLAT